MKCGICNKECNDFECRKIKCVNNSSHEKIEIYVCSECCANIAQEKKEQRYGHKKLFKELFEEGV